MTHNKLLGIIKTTNCWVVVKIKKRNNLIFLRMQMKWTQKQVVEKLKEMHNIEITVSYYGMIEQGKRRPSLTLAQAISVLFGTNTDDIFFAEKNNKTLGA